MTPAAPKLATPPGPTLAPEWVARLVEVVGRHGVITDPDRLLVYESDGLVHHRGRPAAVVLPADTGEAAAVVRLLAAAGVPVVPRGAGTGLSGGAVPSPGSVVVGTARMNRILALEPRRRRARLQAGVVNAHLSVAAAPHGLHYAPDPSSQTACTIGGNVAENSGGPHCLKYGVTSRYVTGLTVVTPEGQVVDLDVDDPEHTGLVGAFVGSEGCFGLVTEVEVRLVPPPPAVRTLLAAFPTLEAAGSAVSALIARGSLPAALEILDRHTIQAVEESIFAAGYPRDAGAVLVAEFDGPPDVLEAEAATARQIFEAHGATGLREAADDVERAALWKGRKKAFGAMGRLAPDLLVQDATVPRSRLPEVLAGIDDIARRHDLRVANVFHAGDGNLHPNLVFDRRDAEQVARVEAASREIMELCVAAGGTITGEHGVGVDKRHYMGLVHSPRELALQRAVRRVFDPHGLWNPGKVLPDPEGDVSGVSARADADGRSAHDDADAPGGSVRRGRRGGSPADGVVHYEPADLVITVAADTPLGRIQERVAAEGQWLAVDARGIDDLTVGEWVEGRVESTFAGSHGAVRDLVLGAHVERPSGEVVRLGGRVVKNVAGFQLLALLVGSEGRLGRVQEATLRLWPLPEVDCTVRVEAADPRALVEAADAVASGRLPPDAVELTWSEEGAVLSARAVGSRERVEAVLAEATARLDDAGLPWTSVVGFRSRMPALPRDVGHVRRWGFVGDSAGAVATCPGPRGWLQVDQGVCGWPDPSPEGVLDRASDPVERWWDGIAAAFHDLETGAIS